MGRGLLIIALLVAATGVRAQPELIERTLAIVAGQPITLSDVRIATTLGLIDVAASENALATATRRLIERTLVLREVQRYAPPEPADSMVDARHAAVRARFASADVFAATLDSLGFADAQLRTWLRDDLRISAYIEQRFTASGVPGEDEVAAEYAKRREEFEKSGLTFEQAAPSIRDRIAAQRRAELTTDWIADLRRRTPVVELLKP